MCAEHLDGCGPHHALPMYCYQKDSVILGRDADIRSVDLSNLETGDAALEAASFDFGRVVRKRPKAIARPLSAQNVVKIVAAANLAACPVTIQGACHSQSGQSLSDDGILLDMTGLDRIGAVDRDQIRVQGGGRWRDLVYRVYSEGYLPLALTTHLSVTVGGTLSTAGLSETTHLYGTQADSVTELEVVTGDGRRLRCSQESNAALFDCVRCGQGQFGVITEARIQLRKALPRVRTFSLLYDDVSSFMRDMELIVGWERFQYIDSWCLPFPRSVWDVAAGNLYARRIYTLNLTMEWSETPPNQDEALEGLRYAYLRGSADNSTLSYVTRMEGRSSSDWFEDRAKAHPNMEGILPWKTFAPFMEETFAALPGPVARAGRVMLGPFRNHLFRSPLLMRPDDELLMGFGILIELPRPELESVLPALAEASDRLVAFGGKRYLAGWVDFDRQRWQAHFGEQWPRMVQSKQEFDPNYILNPGGIPLQPVAMSS